MARLTSTTLCVGDAAPHFVLSALNGQRVELTEFLDRGALLLIFAPGVWSPNVRRQLVDLAAAYDRFRAAGLQISMVVTQDRRRVVERLTYVTPPFDVLADERRVAARDYGVYRALSLDGIGVTRPAVFLIDTEGVLRFVYVGEGDADVVDTPTLLRLACWLVGAPALAEVALPEDSSGAPVLEAEEPTLVLSEPPSEDGREDGLPSLPLGEGGGEDRLPPLPLGEGGGEGVPVAVSSMDEPGQDAPAYEAPKNGGTAHPDELTQALPLAELTATDGSGDGHAVDEISGTDGRDSTPPLGEPTAEKDGDGAAIADDAVEVQTKP